MIDLNELPRSETEDYDVFFGNITGACSMITIMRKGKVVVPHRSCAFVAFIDMNHDEPKFDWHENVEELPSKPFSEEWVIEQYKLHREKAFNA